MKLSSWRTGAWWSRAALPSCWRRMRFLPQWRDGREFISDLRRRGESVAFLTICEARPCELSCISNQHKRQTGAYEHVRVHSIRFEGEIIPRTSQREELDPGASAREGDGVVSNVSK